MAGACDLSLLQDAGGLNNGCLVNKPPPGYVMSPWVKVRFLKGGSTITVGNKSSPDNNNHAVIKSFEFGHADGLECVISIVDEQGSSFVKFMEDLLKDANCAAPSSITMLVDFGWTITNCDGSNTIKKNLQTYCMMCDNVSCNFRGGKFLFMVTGADLIGRSFDYREDKIRGDDVNKMHLTDAISLMFKDQDYPPNVGSVKFQRYNSGGSIEKIVFKDGSEKGPLGTWRPESMDKLNTAMKWLRSCLTVNDKTVFPTYNSEAPQGEIIFWEDFQPQCGENKNWDANCLGTFIVNGGKDSSVIEFSPDIRWDFKALNTGGNMGEGQVMATPDGGKHQGRPDCPTLDQPKTAGSTFSIPVDQNMKDLHGKKAAQVTARASDEQIRGWRLFHEDIEADLVVIGDPMMMRPSLAINSKNVKIVFLNPFHIFEGASDSCAEWLAAPLCNEVLSNKAWNIKAVTHRIEGGNFTTTLRVWLSVPGTVLDIGAPLGGQGSGGWVPPASC